MAGAALDGLHPRLARYFAAIPPGHVGRGRGVFDVVGTPRRWLWPILALRVLDGIVFPVWERDVPFAVVNRPAQSGVTARRVFELRSGTRTMHDTIVATSAGLVDRLGRRGVVEAALSVEVVDGALRLSSTRVAVRAAGRWIALPTVFAPRVLLTERFDDDLDRQCVSITVDAPLIGRIYEYRGEFSYEIVAETAGES